MEQFLTVIMASNSGDRVIIGYNAGSELDGSPIIGSYCPWIYFGDWALGIAGVSGVQRLLEWGFRARCEFSDSVELINFVNNVLLDNDVGSKVDGDSVRTFGFSGIIVHKSGKIWDISNCLALTEMPAGQVWSRGSGSEYALGAFDTLKKFAAELSDKAKMAAALEVAIENDIYSVGPAVVTVLGQGNDEAGVVPPQPC